MDIFLETEGSVIDSISQFKINYFIFNRVPRPFLSRRANVIAPTPPITGAAHD